MVQWVREDFVVHDSKDALILNNEKDASIDIFFIIIFTQMSLRIVAIFYELDKSERLDIQDFLRLIFGQVYKHDLIVCCKLRFVRQNRISDHDILTLS